MTTDIVEPAVQKKKRMVGNGQHSGNSWSTNNANGHIEHGPFLVEDDGFGPLINDLGQLVLVAAAHKNGMSVPLLYLSSFEAMSLYT